MKKKLLAVVALTLASAALTSKPSVSQTYLQCVQVQGQPCQAGTTTKCWDGFNSPPLDCTCLVRPRGSQWICLGPLVP